MSEVKKGVNKFYIGNEKTPEAEMTYVPSGDHRIIIDHTHVSEELKGKGAGKELLAAVVKWARDENKKIIPLCPYAKVEMEKNPEYHDMID